MNLDGKGVKTETVQGNDEDSSSDASSTETDDDSSDYKQHKNINQITL